MSSLEDKVDQLFAALQLHAEETSANFAELGRQNETIRAELQAMNKRLDRVEQRLDRVEQRLDRLELRMERLEARVEGLEARLSRLEARVGTLEITVAGLVQDMAELKADAQATRREIATYHGAVVGHGIQITELEERLRRIERHLDLPPLRTQ